MDTETQNNIPRPTIRVPIPNSSDKPRVEVTKHGDVVKTIRLSCTCGCSVDIHCNYNEND